MPRHRGKLEDRLREAVRARITGRGAKAALARAIGKPQSFVTEYLQKKQHANLDTSVALAKAYGFSLRALTGLDPYPVFDAEIEALVTAYRNAAVAELREAVFAILQPSGSVAPGQVRRGRSPRAPVNPAQGGRNH